jgi:hypothetical protein
MKAPQKKPRFSFDELKIAATSIDAQTRKKVFAEYFEMFEEFPSYLFDNEHGIDRRLYQTIQDLSNDPDTTKLMQKGIAALLARLPSLPASA